MDYLSLLKERREKLDIQIRTLEEEKAISLALEARVAALEEEKAVYTAGVKRLEAILNPPVAPEEQTVKLRLSSGESICSSSGNHKGVLRCSFDEGQRFKIVPITSGIHSDHVVFEAVGGTNLLNGKTYVLDNYGGESKSLCFYKRHEGINANQRWKISSDGKISSANGGRQIKAGRNGTFTFAEKDEEGDSFTLC